MVCETIAASFTAKVAGRVHERVFYRLLNLVAFVAFLAAIAGIALKANEKITEVEVDALDVFPWPVMFFCMQDDGGAMEQAIGLEMKPKTIADNGVDCEKDAAVVWSMDLGSDESGAPARKCLSIKGRDSSPLAKDLERRFKLFSKEPSAPDGRQWKCSTVNEDGELGSSPEKYKEVQMDWYTQLAQNQYDEEFFFVWAGILDPKIKTLAEQKETFTYFTIPFVNSYTQLTFTVDTHVEKDWTNMFTSTAVGERVKAASEMAVADKVKEYMKDDAVKLKYNPALNTKPMAPNVAVGTGGQQRSRLVFHPLNYVSRTVTTRYKTWDEIWTAVGGAWATAAMLVAAFYVQKEVKVPPEHPVKKQKTTAKSNNASETKSQENKEQLVAEVMEEVQVFRLRGITSREQAVKEVFSMAVDGFDAYGANKDAVAESDAA